MKKILAFVMLAAFISAAGFVFSGCSDDKKKDITNGASVSPFEGTWKEASGANSFKFTGSNVIYVYLSRSYEGTFEYDETVITAQFIHTATGNAITENVTWLEYTHAPDKMAYSITDENNIIISGIHLTKIS